MRTMALRPADGSLRGQFWSRWGQTAARAAFAIRDWRRRGQGRGELARLDARMLADIGVTRAEAWAEVNKPFWRE